MKTIQQIVMSASIGTAALLALSGCADMSAQDRNTAIGAGAGAVVGHAVSGGSAAGTIGGAAVGGVIGNQVKTTK
jgi:osmotically inducible lipoprotein OsmB